jgi:amidase
MASTAFVASRGPHRESSSEAGPLPPSEAPSPTGDELWRLDATDLAAAIRRREVSCLEVIDGHLQRIQAVNGSVNAVTVVLEDEARQAAKAADRTLARGGTGGPLLGVPVTVKENVDVAGSATTEGIARLRDNVARDDSPHVAQLRRAGAIPVARTNLPDLGLRWHTDSGWRGPTRNPWNAALTPGGSSGGDAVAVATGMTPLGLGNDYGGSLRYPAQCCGVAAIRPSRGRVASFSAAQLHHEWSLTQQLFAVQGPMARTIRDLRLALAHMSGPDARDPWWTPAPLAGPRAQAPLRVALTVDPDGGGVDPDVAAGVRAAAGALSAAGYVVEEVSPPAVGEAAELWNRLVSEEIHAAAGDIASIASADAVAFLNHFLAVNPRRDPGHYASGFARRNAIQRDWSLFFERFAVIVGPVSTRQPFRVGTDLGGVEAVRQMLESMRLVLCVSLLGLPAVALPVGQAGGIPQGVQVIGAMYREDLCLDVAEVIERASPVALPIDPRGSR